MLTMMKSRYTDLLLQHHAALTAGLIELYSRSLKGHKWIGPPVEEVNGIPSVHRILEELGVIEGEDEADTDTKTGANIPPGREAVAPLRIRSHKDISSGPKIKRLPPMPQLHVPDERSSKNSSPPICSPVTATSVSAKIAPARSPPSRDVCRDAGRKAPTQYVVSSPESGAGGTGTGTYTSTPSPWNSSPEFTEELFTTPVPSPTASSSQPDFQYEQKQFPQQPQMPETAIYAKGQSRPPMIPRTSSQTSVPFDFSSADMYMREPLVPNSLGLGMSFPTTSTTGSGASIDIAETCGAGYFYDATTAGMGTGTNLYGWDYSTGVGNGAASLGYQDFGSMEYNSWDSGVFV